MRAVIVRHQDIPITELGGGVSRRVLATQPELMIVEVAFQKGGEGAVHTHPHHQSTYVLSGRFRFTIDGEPVDVGPSDTIAFESNVPHGTLCLETGVLVDIFTPMREDFLK